MTVIETAFVEEGVTLERSLDCTIYRAAHSEAAVRTYRNVPGLDFLGSKELVERLLYAGPPLPIPLAGFALQEAIDLCRFFIDYVSQLQRFLRVIPGAKGPTVGGEIRVAVITADGVTPPRTRVLRSEPLLEHAGPTLYEGSRDL